MTIIKYSTANLELTEEAPEWVKGSKEVEPKDELKDAKEKTGEADGD